MSARHPSAYQRRPATLASVSFRAATVLLLAAQEAVFRVDVNLVTVPVQVSTLDGSAARDLTREDFELFDNGEPRAIDSVWHETDLPLTLGLVIDVSGSQTEWVAAHRATFSEFLRRLLRKDDRAFLVTVGADVKLVTDTTGSLPALLAGLLQAESGEKAGSPLGEQCAQVNMRFQAVVIRQCGDTALWNAVWAAAKLRMLPVGGRKALLILSDGIDTGSTHSLPQAVAELHRAETVAYSIQYPRQSRRSSVGLQRLAEETGGLRFLPPEGPYESVFARIEEDLRNQYVLGFRPPDEGGYHRLEVRARREDLRLRARSGYFASGKR
jgi:VWFA-related protein